LESVRGEARDRKASSQKKAEVLESDAEGQEKKRSPCTCGLKKSAALTENIWGGRGSSKARGLKDSKNTLKKGVGALGQKKWRLPPQGESFPRTKELEFIRKTGGEAAFTRHRGGAGRGSKKCSIQREKHAKYCEKSCPWQPQEWKVWEFRSRCNFTHCAVWAGRSE